MDIKNTISAWIRKFVRSNKNVELDDDNNRDPQLWTRDLETHGFGEYSFAVVQANRTIEDYSQVETGHNATFIGVYDGHAGPDAARFTCDHLFIHLIRFVRGRGGSIISFEPLRDAVAATEEGFFEVVRDTRERKPSIQSMGTCCLAGIISQGTLYVANLGDSRAVLGRLKRPNSTKIVAEQITEDHNVSVDSIRRELMQAHRDDPNIVLKRNGAWRVKGIIQITRSIGDAYMKDNQYALGPAFPRFQLPAPLIRPALLAIPALYTRQLQPSDRFVVFASDGLWEHLTNKEVVKLVHKYPRLGIARRLIKSAVTEASRKMNLRYEAVKRIDVARRRVIHDDITVVVLYIDGQVNADIAELSMRGFANAATASAFNTL